jgi:hypothetical protein
MQTLKEHLISRHMNLDIHRPFIDEENGFVYFWFYNLSGKLVGYQRYNPNGTKPTKSENPRYYSYGGTPTVRVWGIETYQKDCDVIFVTEGIFDACRLTNHGLTAFSTITNSPSQDMMNWFHFLPQKKVAILDNDVAGEYMKKYFKYTETVPSPYKDLGECPEEYVQGLIRKYSSVPIQKLSTRSSI